LDVGLVPVAHLELSAPLRVGTFNEAIVAVDNARTYADAGSVPRASGVSRARS
jgi:hypothetical protein